MEEITQIENIKAIQFTFYSSELSLLLSKPIVCKLKLIYSSLNYVYALNCKQ